MPLPVDPELAKLELFYERAVVSRKTAEALEFDTRRREDEARKQLYEYIREIGYCPHCELQLEECKGHGQVVHERIRDRRRPHRDK